MVTAKYYLRIPKKILKQCPEVTGNCSSGVNYSNFVFFNEDNVAVGAVYLMYEEFRQDKGIPKSSVYICSFEVCKSQYGKGYGTEMLKWIENNLPIYRIELTYRNFNDDNRRSYNFWRSQGFYAKRGSMQELCKTLKRL